MNGPTAPRRRRLEAVTGTPAGRAGAAVGMAALLAAGVVVVTSAGGPDDADGVVATRSTLRPVLLSGPGAVPPTGPTSPAGLTPLAGGSSAAAVLPDRNPFVAPSPPPVEEPAAPPVPAGPPPGGRNPFEALVVLAPPAPTGQPVGTTDVQGGVPADGAALLRLGSRGEDVRALQQRLRDRGWRIDVDGDFGPRTDAVVRAFQARRDLAADGVVGPFTRAALG